MLIEGERITWEFEYVNGSDRTIQLLRDEDVRPDCGCSSLTVSRRALGPGERASIRAVVETTGRRGKFTHGGTVTWHDDAGTPIPVQVALSGEVSPVIQVRAGQLTFGAEDIRAGTAKEVTLTSRLPIDWSALSFDVSEPQLFAVSRVGTVENGVRYTVRCLLPPDVESAAAATATTAAFLIISPPRIATRRSRSSSARARLRSRRRACARTTALTRRWITLTPAWLPMATRITVGSLCRPSPGSRRTRVRRGTEAAGGRPG